MGFVSFDLSNSGRFAVTYSDAAIHSVFFALTEPTLVLHVAGDPLSSGDAPFPEAHRQPTGTDGLAPDSSPLHQGRGGQHRGGGQKIAADDRGRKRHGVRKEGFRPITVSRSAAAGRSLRVHRRAADPYRVRRLLFGLSPCTSSSRPYSLQFARSSEKPPL
eukprot:6927961-Pyramimonas_sp.AAC.1